MEVFFQPKQGNYNRLVNLTFRNILFNTRKNAKMWEDIFRKSKRDFHCVQATRPKSCGAQFNVFRTLTLVAKCRDQRLVSDSLPLF